MNAMIKVDLNENQEPIVSGRELHEVLEIKTEYKKWFDRMKEYGFTENIDYARVTQKCPTLGGEQDIVNHAIKLDMAKEIAMIQRNDKGKQIRQYFIQVEKDFNSPEKVMARALKFAEQKLNVLQIENAQVEIRNKLLNYKTNYAEIDSRYQNVKSERASAKKQIRYAERKIKNLDNAKKRIRKNFERKINI